MFKKFVTEIKTTEDLNIFNDFTIKYLNVDTVHWSKQYNNIGMLPGLLGLTNGYGYHNSIKNYNSALDCKKELFEDTPLLDFKIIKNPELYPECFI